MRPARFLAAAFTTLLILSACSTSEAEPTELILITHDSFVLSEGILGEFTADTGITVTVLNNGDAGAMVNQAILTKDNPVGDVMFGVDTTFLTRAVNAGIFVEYQSPLLSAVPDELEYSSAVTPIDVGDVCINYDKQLLGNSPPTSLQDLANPAFRGQLVVENPATSSPGLAFLLATISEFGEDGWQDYWRSLVANDVLAVSGWEEAYWGEFTIGGGGDRPIVVSYASSPPAEVFYGELDEAPTASMRSGCFRQVEYAGILQDSMAAEALIDFLLSITVQEDIPLSMFVFPANAEAVLPDLFVQYTEMPENPLTMNPEDIEAHRDRWIAEWTDIVLP